MNTKRQMNTEAAIVRYVVAALNNTTHGKRQPKKLLRKQPYLENAKLSPVATIASTNKSEHKTATHTRNRGDHPSVLLSPPREAKAIHVAVTVQYAQVSVPVETSPNKN